MSESVPRVYRECTESVPRVSESVPRVSESVPRVSESVPSVRECTESVPRVYRECPLRELRLYYVMTELINSNASETSLSLYQSINPIQTGGGAESARTDFDR